MDPNLSYTNPVPSPAPMASPAPAPTQPPVQIYDQPTPPPSRKKPALPTVVFAVISVLCLGFAVFFLCQYINASNQVTSLTSTLNAKDQSIVTYETRISELEAEVEECKVELEASKTTTDASVESTEVSE